MSKLRAFVPTTVFSAKELEDLDISYKDLNRAYLISLADHETMLSPSVRQSMLTIVKIIAKHEEHA